MTALSDLRRRLTSLRLARGAARWCTAFCRALAALLALLGLLLLLDVALLESWSRDLRLSRWLLPLAASASVAWCLGRLAWPLVRVRESNVQLALSLGHKLGLPNDLVAALQFDQPQAARWGSRQLERAVIDKAARQATAVRVMNEVPWRPLGRGLLWLAGAALGWTIVLALAGPHVSVFRKRLLAGADTYPTRTRLERLVANRQALIDASTRGPARTEVRVGQGRPVKFSVDCRGELPEDGRLTLWSPADQPQAQQQGVLVLKRVQIPSHLLASGLARYEVTLPRALRPLQFRLEIGDVRTPVMRLNIVPRPLVAISWRVEPPDYARHAPSTTDLEHAPGQPVLEGSHVALRVRPLNGKSLRAAWLWVRQRGERQRIDLQPGEVDEEIWQSPRNAAMLSRIAGNVQYELQVRDEDGLSLQTPARGVITVQPDRPPAASLATVHRVVLPAATPRLEYRLFDDFGIATARLLVEIERTPAKKERVSVSLSPAGEGFPLTGELLPVSGTHPLALADWKLHRGDRLTITLQVEDHRGNLPRRQAVSQPIQLEVTDEQGLMDTILETDRSVEQALTEIIARELGIEESP